MGSIVRRFQPPSITVYNYEVRSFLRLAYCSYELRGEGKCVSSRYNQPYPFAYSFSFLLKREMPVFGIVQGQVVVGIIVRYSLLTSSRIGLTFLYLGRG